MRAAEAANSFARSAGLVRGVFFVLGADVLEDVGVRKKLLDEADGDGHGEGLRVGDGHGDVHVPEIAAMEALLNAHVLAMAVAARVQPAIEDPRAGRNKLDKLSQPVEQEGRRYSGFNLFNPDDESLLCSILRGEFNSSGLQNKTLRLHLPALNSGQVSRLLKRLRTRRLVKKVGHTYEYYVTAFGKEVVATALKLRELVIIPQLALGLAQLLSFAKGLRAQYPTKSSLPAPALQQLQGLDAQRQQIVRSNMAALQAGMSPARFQQFYSFAWGTEAPKIRLVQPSAKPRPGAKTPPKP